MRRKRAVDRPLRNEPLYVLEERIRELSILCRRGPVGERAARTSQLCSLLAKLPLDQAIVVIRESLSASRSALSAR